MAIVNEVGMDRLCGVMGSAASSVSLSACHLIQVMFEALTEGMKKEIRGKDEAILPGEKPTFTLRAHFGDLLQARKKFPAENVCSTSLRLGYVRLKTKISVCGHRVIIVN